MDFVHLRTHTEFSVVDGTLRVDDMVAAARADGQGALAITDLANLFGAVKFYGAARKKGVKPLLGADVWLEPEGGEKQPSRLLLLVQDSAGYLNLCELLSRVVAAERAAQPGLAEVGLAGRTRRRADRAVGGGAGRGRAGADERRPRCVPRRSRSASPSLFPQRFYIEVQRAGLPGQRGASCARRSRSPRRCTLPVVATHPVQFLTPDDFEAHEARVCVAEGETLSEPQARQALRPRAVLQDPGADGRAVRRPAERAAQQRRDREALQPEPRARQAAAARLPDAARSTAATLPMEEFFRVQSHEGLQARLLQLYPDAAERERQRQRYVDRLDFEIATILKMGFPGYFLIVADFINWAKANGCPVGPGRGSGAGSLVAYSLNITDLDPLRYNLLFERFLNPDRVSMPDFDVDFCQGNRDRVIDYVKQKYGRDAVSQIATFGTMAAKAALRDVGRVLGMGYGHVDSIAKLVPAPPGKTVTLRRPPEPPDTGVIYARREAPEIEEREKKEEEVAELLALAERVEGIVRNVGMHAGGVLIAPGKITDFCPLYMQPGSDSAVSQYDKDDVEAIGLVKFDFLGPGDADHPRAREGLHPRAPRRPGRTSTFEKLPLDDAGAYKLMSEGKTVAVFQLESSGMQRMLRDAKPSVLRGRDRAGRAATAPARWT